jgi:ubiquinone/menaquinone biosynthesis C-methylase UbiE
MASTRVNYDHIAPTYDQRYTVGRFEGIATSLRSLARDVGAERVLEVGCGTGRWLAELLPIAQEVYGLDLSPGMLQQAGQRLKSLSLICGHASHLPFPDSTFDLVFCVNAFHHFPQPRVFISESRRLLRPGGVLAIIGMDPHAGRDRWYLYDYFVGTYETDSCRFSSGGTVVDWMIAAGFAHIDWRVVEHLTGQHVGRAVLADPILQKHGTSQLVLLTDEAYAAGMSRIRTALDEADATGKTLIFPVDISLTMVAGRV